MKIIYISFFTEDWRKAKRKLKRFLKKNKDIVCEGIFYEEHYKASRYIKLKEREKGALKRAIKRGDMDINFNNMLPYDETFKFEKYMPTWIIRDPRLKIRTDNFVVYW